MAHEKHTTLRLPEREYATLNRLAKQHDRSTSAEVRVAIRAWIEQHTTTKGETR